jgi:hypothetical protein
MLTVFVLYLQPLNTKVVLRLGIEWGREGKDMCIIYMSEDGIVSAYLKSSSFVSPHPPPSLSLSASVSLSLSTLTSLSISLSIYISLSLSLSFSGRVSGVFVQADVHHRR